jgi:hypothetical protein
VGEAGAATEAKSSGSRVRAWCWLASRGMNGEAGEGFWRAYTKSRAAARARSEEAVGMGILLGNHASVSATRSAHVSVIQTRWQR